MPGRGALRLANVDARRSKRDCQTARPLHARRHRRDHASQISPGQGHAALPPPIGPARVDLVRRRQATNSRQGKSGGIQAIFRVPSEPVTQWPRERRGKIGRKIMSIRKCFSQTSVVVSILLLTAVRPLAAATPSESERLEKLERAVEQLQKRNAELEAEVRSLKKQTAFAPEGKMKKQVTYDGKTYVEKAVVEEEKPIVYVQQRGPELKLVLGGFIQTNFEDGDVSAFEGRFGQTALKDRFRLRRARIAMTGDFREQTFGSTGIGFRQRKSRSANIKRHSAWSSSLLTPPCSLSSAVFPPGLSLQNGKSGSNFGESHLRTSGPSRRTC